MNKALVTPFGLSIWKSTLVATLLLGLILASTRFAFAQTEPEKTYPPEVRAPAESQAASLVEYSLPSATNVDLCQIDLVFVADGSGSIGPSDFEQIKQFIRAFVASINIGGQGTQVSLVQFSSEGTGRVEQSLTDSLPVINAAIDNMVQLGDATDIQEGIQLAAAELQAHGRANTQRVVVVLTDGIHNQPGDPLAESAAFRQTGGFVFTISVGADVDRNQLIGISSQPYTRYLYSVADVNSLAAILTSLSENVCTCQETENASQRVTRVADGLCLRVFDDNIYIGSANLANSNVRLKLSHEFADQSAGLFTKKTLKEHIQTDGDLTTLACLPPFALPFIPGIVCVRSPSQYYVAINGTAHDQELANPDHASADSILAINGQLYRENGVGVPDAPRASFFEFSGTTSAIHRAYTTAPAPSPSFAIPVDPNAPSGDYAQARDYIVQATTASRFAVGYRASLLDLTATPPLRGDIDDPAAFSELTAIGVSADGMTVYLAATKPGVGPITLANKLADLGASRAILLDGSSSTQFASFRENYSAFYPLNFSLARPILNGVAAYSVAGNVASSIQIAVPSGNLVLSPNTTIELATDSLPIGTTLTQLPAVLASPGAIDGTPFFLPLPSAPLLNTGIAYVTYAQDPSGQVIQPTSYYGIIANIDLLDFPFGISPCMLRIYFWNGAQWVLEPNSRVDLVRHAVRAYPEQFGVWAIFANPNLTCLYLPVVQRAPDPVAPVEPFNVTLSTNSSRQYELQRMENGDGLSSGSRVYTDRNYRYDDVPGAIQGITYIRTANDDSVRYDLALTISANRPVQVYVGHTDQQNPKPAWLNAFQDTGEDLTFKDRDGNRVRLSVFTATFPAGDIVLGANTPPGGGDHSMYTVALKEVVNATASEANSHE